MKIYSFLEFFRILLGTPGLFDNVNSVEIFISIENLLTCNLERTMWSSPGCHSTLPIFPPLGSDLLHQWCLQYQQWGPRLPTAWHGWGLGQGCGGCWIYRRFHESIHLKNDLAGIYLDMFARTEMLFQQKAKNIEKKI